ncbi:hypothetical protein C0993_012607, partial [Termitomyces sp. T159_Od127]
KERQAGAQKHAAIQACRAGYLPFANLDFLDPPLLVLPCGEALYKDNWSSGRALKKELGGEFRGIYHSEFPDEGVEVGDQIYATTLCLPLPIEEIHASQTTSQ